MCLKVRRPAVDQQTNGQEEATDAHDVQTLLRLEVSSLNVPGDSPIAVMDVCKLADERADAQPEEREASDAAVPVVLVGEYSGECREENVEICIRDGYIKRDGEADG